MSITDELREWARACTVRGMVLTTYPEKHEVRGTLEDLTAIADRIDAEHERQLEVLYRDMSDAEYVKLPVDADGETWTGSERVFATDAGTRYDMRHLMYDGKRWLIDSSFGGFDALLVHHYHAPTVEDVLQEFADQYAFYSAIEGDIHPDLKSHEEVLRRFAAKLRLADE